MVSNYRLPEKVNPGNLKLSCKKGRKRKIQNLLELDMFGVHTHNVHIVQIQNVYLVQCYNEKAVKGKSSKM